jgi:hypothetical protein
MPLKFLKNNFPHTQAQVPRPIFSSYIAYALMLQQIFIKLFHAQVPRSMVKSA